MSRAWWWKAGFVLAVTVVSLLYLVPTAAQLSGREAKLPAFFKNHLSKTIQLGLDLQGGLQLVYAVDMQKRTDQKLDNLVVDLNSRLVRDKKVTDVVAERSGEKDIVLKFKNPEDTKKVDSSFFA